jgi:integrase
MEVVMGMIYKRGKVWWIKYHRNGKSFRESSKSTKKMVAERLLKRREGDIAQGKIPGIQFEKVSFDDLAKEYIKDYRINQKKSVLRAEISVNHLKKHFEGMKVPNISSPMINSYIEKRLIDKATNATINRELAALKRMLNIGAKQTPPVVDRVPYIPLLKENNARKGFFEHGEFLELRDELPPFLKGFVTFAYKVGWRISEISGLTWNQVDRNQGIVRLEVGETKNDSGRTVYLDDELKTIFNHQWNLRKTAKKLLPYVFLNRKGTDKIRRFDKTWKNACKDAGIGIRLFHDFRRTAVRNMVRSGVPERVAMMISGHKTRSVFDRYNIVNDQDLKLAAKRQEAYLLEQSGHNLGTICHFSAKNERDLAI